MYNQSQAPTIPDRFGSIIEVFPSGMSIKLYKIIFEFFSARGILLIMICLLALPSARSQDIVLNEIMTDNDLTIEDGLGEFSDWIELYNKADSAINLGLYYLTDDPLNLRKWKKLRV